MEKIVAADDTIKDIVKSEIDRLGLEADLNHIDTSEVTNMTGLFAESRFNGIISGWDVSNVFENNWMFSNSQFNGDISGWKFEKLNNPDSYEYIELEDVIALFYKVRCYINDISNNPSMVLYNLRTNFYTIMESELSKQYGKYTKVIVSNNGFNRRDMDLLIRGIKYIDFGSSTIKKLEVGTIEYYTITDLDHYDDDELLAYLKVSFADSYKYYNRFTISNRILSMFKDILNHN